MQPKAFRFCDRNGNSKAAAASPLTVTPGTFLALNNMQISCLAYRDCESVLSVQWLIN